MTKIRLFIDHPLRAGQRVPLAREQAHYLGAVMRQSTGAVIEVFNGHDGAWAAEVTSLSKRDAEVTCRHQTTPQAQPPDLWLLFAPIKKARTDFIVEKAAEMGVRVIQPVQTRLTNSERIRQDRLQAHAIEAAEQCGGTFVPEVRALMRLDMILNTWPEERSLVFCDEAKVGQAVSPKGLRAPAAVLIGPEGGFAPEERAAIAKRPQAVPISLGPRVLRADTAAVAALTVWQLAAGDWR